MNSNPFFKRVYSLYLRANGAVPIGWEAKKERKHASGCLSHVAIQEVKVDFLYLISLLKESLSRMRANPRVHLDILNARTETLDQYKIPPRTKNLLAN